MFQYQKGLSVDKARGVKRRVDSTEVRAHLQRLIHAGASYAQIANATGGKVNDTQVRRLMLGNPMTGKPVAYVFRPTHEALMAVTLDEAQAEFGLLPSIGVHRRIQALSRIGYSCEDVGAELGVTETYVYQLLNRKMVTNRVHAKVDEVYQRLSVKPGTRVRIKWKARREGWPPPLAWDDDNIDDPNAEPDPRTIKCVVEDCGGSVHRRSLCATHYRFVSERGGLRSATRYRQSVLAAQGRQVGAYDSRELLLHELSSLKDQGFTHEQAAERLGRGVAYIKKVWAEAS